ncbi:hypothetical protein JCM21900_001684 [Sporobolomyces salmonicolor]
MGKLKKNRQNASGSSPALPRSSGRPESVLSNSTPQSRPGTTPSPIALRTSAPKPAVAVAQSVDALGDFEVGSDQDDGSSRGKRRSRSPDGPQFGSPASSLASTVGTPSHTRTATAVSIGTSSERSERSERHHPFPSTEGGTSPTRSFVSPTHDSAFTRLRERLDSDQAKRDAVKVREEHVKDGAQKLKKKKPMVDTTEARQENAEPTPDNTKEDETDDLTDAPAYLGGPKRSHKDDELDKEFNFPPVAVNLPPPAADSLPAPPPQQPSQSGGSIILAPAKFGWRLASGTVGYGVDTGKSVLRMVPIAGRFVPTPSSSSSATTTPAYPAAETSPFPSPPTSLVSPAPSFAPSVLTTSHPLAHNLAEKDKSGKSASQDAQEDDHGLLYRAAELSLGLSIASVLVTGALASMAWDRLRRSSCAARKEVA